ncbi:glycosyltransferase family 39 protein [Thalassoglobus sp. JC818]|uniref:glycosyltransferase family 39 protein n=1 Tax=Thalassoglobus sp. JC818 TaxID=3232136 RepID=UPI00345AF7C6
MNDSDSKQTRSLSVADILLFVVSIAAGSFCYFRGISTYPLVLDEHVAYWIAGADNPGSLWQRSLNYSATPPLSSVLQLSAIQVLGKSELAMRLPSYLGYLTGLIGTFLLARELFGIRAAGLASLMIALLPASLEWSRLARPYGFSLGLAAMSLWLTVVRLRTPQKWNSLFAWGGCNVLLIWTHYLNAPLVGLEAAALLWFGAWKLSGSVRPRIRTLIAMSVIALTVIPLIPSLLRMAQWSEVLNFRPTPPSILEILGPLWWAAVPSSLLLAALISSLTLKRSTESVPTDWRAFAVVALWGLGGVLLLGVASRWIPTLAEERYRVIYLPAASAFLAGIFTHNFGKTIATVATICLITVTWSLSDGVPWKPDKLAAPAASDWRELAKIVGAGSHEDQSVIVGSGLIESRLVPAMFEDDVLMDYIACRMGRFYLPTPQQRTALPWIWTDDAKLNRYYTDLVKDQSQLWVVAGTDTDLGRRTLTGITNLLLRSGYREVREDRTPTATLRQFKRIDPMKEDVSYTIAE